MPCREYGEDLVYLFYGKPAFKSSNTLSSRAEYLMPLCFMINHDFVTNMRRAVAFDSGAYNKGLYKDHLHAGMQLREFHLTPEKDSLRKMVQYFYGTNEQYFEGVAKEPADFDPVHAPVVSYLSMLRSMHQTGFDDRKGSLEVQVDYEIPLHSDAIGAVILPKHLSLSMQVRSKLHDQGIRVLTITNYGVAQQYYYVHILELTRSLLVQNQLLHDR